MRTCRSKQLAISCQEKRELESLLDAAKRNLDSASLELQRQRASDTGVLQCVAVCYSVVQCGAVWCSVLQCVAVCCSVLQCV